MRPIDGDALKIALDTFATLVGFGGVYDRGQVMECIDAAPTIGGWISVKDRLPENANHPNAFCPRYLVRTKYGTSEGWYNPNKGCWYTLVWFLIGRYDEDDIDMERGDIPRISNKIDVTHWMPLPEPPKEEKPECD